MDTSESVPKNPSIYVTGEFSFLRKIAAPILKQHGAQNKESRCRRPRHWRTKPTRGGPSPADTPPHARGHTRLARATRRTGSAARAPHARGERKEREGGRARETSSTRTVPRTYSLRVGQPLEPANEESGGRAHRPTATPRLELPTAGWSGP